jgi:hypothetical protein
MINYKYVILIIAVFIYALIIQYRYLAYFIPNKIIKYTPNDFSMEYNEINIDGLNGWLFVNPNINLDISPFFVNSQVSDWKSFSVYKTTIIH